MQDRASLRGPTSPTCIGITLIGHITLDPQLSTDGPIRHFSNILNKSLQSVLARVLRVLEISM